VRQLLCTLPADPTAPIAIAREVQHRLTRVLRLRDGAVIVVGDGLGRQREAVWRGARLVPTTAPRVAPPRTKEITLACGVIKGERFDWLIEKAAELGVAAIQPLWTDHGVVAATDGGRVVRWQSLADAAFEQSGRPWRTVVAEPVTVDGWIASWTGGAVLWCDPAADAAFGEVVRDRISRSPRLAVAIGAEGGFSAREAALMAACGTAATLGPAILRAETAAIAAAAIALID